MVINIPGLDPVAKGRARVTKRGHAYTPKKTKLFEEAVRLSAIAQMRRGGHGIESGPISVHVALVFTPPKSWPKWKRAAAIAGDVKHTGKPDADNLAKGVCDALNGIAWVDDSQIVSLTVSKGYAAESGVFIGVDKVRGFCAGTVKAGDIRI